MELNNKYFKAVKRGMGDEKSKENLACLAQLSFQDLSKKFKLIEEDYPKMALGAAPCFARARQSRNASATGLASVASAGTVISFAPVKERNSGRLFLRGQFVPPELPRMRPFRAQPVHHHVAALADEGLMPQCTILQDAEGDDGASG